MPTNFLALEGLLADIAAYAKMQIEQSELTGPHFATYVKLSWYAQSGSPCFADCQNMIDTLQALRDLEDDSEINAFYVAMTAALMDCFPDVEHAPQDIEEIRRLSADLRKVA